jgi:mRNA-degrading endonuclease toxin of MazEF toxin-antitoxin module
MLPQPEPGLVISYAYIWARERAVGREEGIKTRPCVIVLKVERVDERETIVTVAPITHRSPDPQTAALELPAAVKRHLHLDSERSWVILDEINQFTWPGFDLRPLPGTKTKFDFGLLPPKLYARIVTGVRDIWSQRKGKIVRRDPK